MLQTLGYASLDALIDATVPANIRFKRGLALPAPMSEQDALAAFKGLENEIVILTDLFDAPADERSRADLYVGMTRARTKLFAFVGNVYLEERTMR